MSETKPEPSGTTCRVCGEHVAPQLGAGQPRRYCSRRCKSRADRQRRAERALSPKPAPKPSDSFEVTERLRITRSLSREAAIELVAGDPEALNAALIRTKPLIASPTHRATRWREVAATIGTLSAMIPDD